MGLLSRWEDADDGGGVALLESECLGVSRGGIGGSVFVSRGGIGGSKFLSRGGGVGGIVSDCSSIK